MVMTGSGMLLLNPCEVKGVVHCGIAGNANPDLQIGDVTIPQHWSQTGLWYWQVDRQHCSTSSVSSKEKSSGNTLNSVEYQPEETFPLGIP
ncbi:hypothetical protein C4D60_Mb04t37920 [Musa balbisiana]|uniref:Uncharacterized protein n=1 Tax=Musa balbisiana TaxID=52838 RepID=A0A4S8KHK1_MUSBA|nr:hypothetical protein C4D60_Mb04t37920 [Musa balbisiana]